MNYTEAVTHLLALAPELAPTPGAPPRKFDLDHMRALAQALGNPQDAVPAVLIAGTNGKGSTAATLASILNAAGLCTALYTSPHLVRVNERIAITRDGVLTPIDDEAFARLYTRVDEACESLIAGDKLPVLPSFFERVTALAFLFFAEAHADIAVLEVGLGGRLDATNIVTPLVSVITDIALDHQEYLGDTIAAIAREKCGILREGGNLVTLPQHPEANQSIGEAATALHVHAVDAARYLPPAQRNGSSPPLLSSRRAVPLSSRSAVPLSSRSAAERSAVAPLPRNQYTLSLDDSTEPCLLEVDSPLPGMHQQRNIALAIAAAVQLRNNGTHTSKSASNRACYKIPNAAIGAGIRNTVWPGRLEFLAPNLLLDVAHNPAGAWTLRTAIAALPPSQPRTLIFSCLRDKSLTEMSRILFPLFDSSPDGDPERRHDHILLAPIASPRAAAVEDLVAAAHALGIPAHAAPHLAGALAQARAVTPSGGLIVATGSVYLVGEIRALALEPQAVPV